MRPIHYVAYGLAALAIVFCYIWLRNPEVQIDHVPSFFIGEWKNVSDSTKPPLTFSPTGIGEYDSRKIIQKKKTPVIRIYTSNWRCFEIIIKGDDLIHVSEVIVTENRDGAEREGYEEIGFFARHSARN